MDSEQDAYEQHMQKLQEEQIIPESPYDHAAFLLDKDRSNYRDYDDVHSKHVLMGNIKNDNLAMILQRQNYFLLQFFRLGKRHRGMLEVFKNLWASYTSTFKISRSHGGRERILQHMRPPQAGPMDSMGEQMYEHEQQQDMSETEKLLMHYG